MKRLVLFDIDGTLLTTNGAARRAFHRALLDVFDTAGPIEKHEFDGKTDPQIARELLKAAGLQDAEIDARLPDLWSAYLSELADEVAEDAHETHIYPGVPALLHALQQERARFVLGLLTGNIEQGARIKLTSAGLDEYFEFGAFGSDCEQRDGLPGIAVERARSRTGRVFAGKDVIVIGDTPNDVRCGHALGVFALGVATGRHDSERLLRAGADAVLPDLADTARVLAILTGA